MVLMDTTVTIPTGAAAERWKFSSFCIFTVFIATIIYPIYGNWVWGNGWLPALGRNVGLGHGHVDFAASSAVHITGALLALLAGNPIGPAPGKVNTDGGATHIPGHTIPMAVLGP